jgi:preprotein translocase subunit YajC
MEIGLETQQIYSILAILAAALMVLVTGGVVYLTLIDWQDRRRKSREMLDNLPRRRNKKAR